MRRVNNQGGLESFRHGNLVINGTIYVREIIDYIKEETTNCGCENIDEGSYLYTQHCGTEIERYYLECTNINERPFWCDSEIICVEEDGVLHMTHSGMNAYEDDDTSYDSKNSCFMPEIVPAQVIIEGITSNSENK